MSVDRSWMWRRFDEKGFISAEFDKGVNEFLDFAYSHPNVVDHGKIRCPCAKCDNRKFNFRDNVHYHIKRNGFKHGYTTWDTHGELRRTYHAEECSGSRDEEDRGMRTMVVDAAGPNFDWGFDGDEHQGYREQPPNPSAQKFFDLLKDANEPLWEGCERHTRLSAVSQLLNIKSEFNLSHTCYDRIMSSIKSMMPEDEKLPNNLYKAKKMVAKLGLGYDKIDVCANNCMLYYKETKDHKKCMHCGHERYVPRKVGSKKDIAFKVLRYLPLIPRLQRLYMSKTTASQMTWHWTNQCEEGLMAHPSHSEAWKHFDQTHPSFSSEPRNVRMGLCTDGFTPFSNSGAPYSCWPVMSVVYNLPPGMCMEQPYILLNMVIPGPKSPGKKLDVFLRPLVDELKDLWNVGVETYDAFTQQNFTMRVALFWTISDFPAYGMLSCWSTHGLLSCPYCMEHTKSFRLSNGRKQSWFDCHRQFLPSHHSYRRQSRQFFKGRIEKDSPPPRLSGEEIRRRVSELPSQTYDTFGNPKQLVNFGDTHNWVKRSIFWDLPYWSTNLIRHNLDVMHIEKNVFDNIFNTVLDVKDKSKDNGNARKDLEQICDRPQLHLFYDPNGKLLKPKASYTEYIINSFCH